MPRPLSESKELIEELVKQGIPRNAIAQRLEVSPSSITAFCKNHSIGKKRITLKNFHNDIIADVESGKTLVTIAKRYGATVGGIYKYLEARGHKNLRKKTPKPHSLDPHQLAIQEMLTQGYLQKEIAQRIGTHPSTLNIYIQSRKLKPKARTTAGIRPKPEGHTMANIVTKSELPPTPCQEKDRPKYDPTTLPLEKPIWKRFDPQTDDGKIKQGMCQRCGVRRPDRIRDKYCHICKLVIKIIERNEQEDRQKGHKHVSMC